MADVIGLHGFHDVTETRWHRLPQQDFFVQVLDKLGRQDIAAANLVSRSWHTGLQQQVASLAISPDRTLHAAADGGLGHFSALARLSILYNPQFSTVLDRTQEYERLAAALSTVRLRTLVVTGLAAAQRDLAALQKLSHLQSLTVGLRPSAEISTLRCLHQLTRLHLHVASAAQQRQVSTVTGLHELYGLQIDSHRDLSYLTVMAALTNLTLGCSSFGKHQVDLAGMGSLGSLKKLWLRTVNQDMDFKPLSGLTALRSLTMLCKGAVEVGFMGNLQRLTKLAMEVDAVMNPMHLSLLTALDDLNLRCPRLTVFGWLSRLSNLRSVTLKTPMLHDLAPFSRLLLLEALRLTGQMTSLHDLAGLNVEELSLKGCLQLTDVSALHTISKLQVLCLSSCAGAVTHGLSAAGLTQLFIRNGDMMPLAEVQALSRLTNLRQLTVFGDRNAASLHRLQAAMPWVRIG